MTNVWSNSIISVLVVSLISLIGIFTFSIKQQRLNKILNYLISFAVGALIGDVFIHILPELSEKGITPLISTYILLGIVFTFIIEKIVHFHHSNKSTIQKYKPYAITSLYADSIHNLIDGIIIGASYLVGFSIGIATTIAVILHEIPTEVGHFGVLLKGGFKRNTALFMNFLSALTSVVGVILALLLSSKVQSMSLFLLSFTAGNFIYIAGSDLIPELHKEVGVRRSIIQFIWLILGIAIMYTLIFLE